MRRAGRRTDARRSGLSRDADRGLTACPHDFALPQLRYPDRDHHPLDRLTFALDADLRAEEWSAGVNLVGSDLDSAGYRIVPDFLAGIPLDIGAAIKVVVG